MASMKATPPTRVVVFMAFEIVAHNVAELKHPLCPNLSIKAPIDICKLSSTPATDCEYRVVRFSTLKISKCFSTVCHWYLVGIAENGDHCLNCRRGYGDLFRTGLSRS